MKLLTKAQFMRDHMVELYTVKEYAIRHQLTVQQALSDISENDWERYIEKHRIVDSLQDGTRYWLGATFGRFDVKSDSFCVGNCFVERSKTIYSKTEVKS
jgi:hypothetical protein